MSRMKWTGRPIFSTRKSLRTMMQGLDDGIIDVEPEYQRDVVWTADRMTGLIDSLMENYYIPPIILNKKTRIAEDGVAPKHTLICVDGKQRLSSVKAFIKGMIPCHDHLGAKWWFCDGQNSRRKKVLSEETQKQFLQREFVSFEYADLSEVQEEDLFARVQMGMQLTLPEKMRASTGPWQELARLFVNDFGVIFSLLKDRARAKDFQIALSCFSQIVEVQHPSAPNGVPTLKTTYTSLPKLLENKGAVDDGMKSHLASVFNTFKDLIEEDPNTFTNADKTLKGVQTFAPIEMVAVTVLISMYSDTRNNRLLLGDIQALRSALRENFHDIRMNRTIWRFIWDFIDKLEQIRGAVDGSTINRSVKARPAPTPGAPTPIQQAAVAAVPTVARRGRPTARTKPATVLPGSRPAPSATMQTEDQPATSPVDPRPPKRKRTNPGSISTSTLGAATPSPFLASAQAFAGGITPSGSLQTPRPPFINQVPMSSRSAIHKQPTTTPSHANQRPQKALTSIAGLPVSLPTRNTPPQRLGDATVPPATAPIRESTRGPLATPPEARQNRISELNSYRVPPAPMGTMAPSTAPMSQSVSTAPMTSYSMVGSFVGAPWALPSHTPPPQQAGLPISSSRSRFAGPIRAPEQPQEVLRNVSQSPVQPKASVPAQPAQKPRPQASSRPLPQYDGAIDLMEDDVEQERRDLLSSFGATASAEHRLRHISRQSTGSTQPHNLSAPTQQQRPIVVEDLTAGEPEGYNNPYQRLKQRMEQMASRF
ncbi:hypothetical protein BU26DRAFT_41383 [Trematosphaeria pertusa]|uniref:GmrSD restriction endonucleases N-terminal domain-containing protein n=1 Tax=Trematosphaeria pertusa TaxID=390896 RepID=A0A6A6J3N2_9PLEO|nr:uncharacterized protein BU26DRAFT_41383 [Trematosphaeria pertusa]KAF2257309.1 hypothetical protein BU26DRAFT_41383 [Trematosphaeria pertusa]